MRMRSVGNECGVLFLLLRIRRPPRSTRTDTLFPYTTLFRSEPVEAADLLDFLAGQLAGYEVPAEVRILGELPRTDSGKVDLSAVDAVLHDSAPEIGRAHV